MPGGQPLLHSGCLQHRTANRSDSCPAALKLLRCLHFDTPRRLQLVPSPRGGSKPLLAFEEQKRRKASNQTAVSLLALVDRLKKIAPTGADELILPSRQAEIQSGSDKSQRHRALKRLGFEICVIRTANMVFGRGPMEKLVALRNSVCSVHRPMRVSRKMCRAFPALLSSAGMMPSVDLLPVAPSEIFEHCRDCCIHTCSDFRERRIRAGAATLFVCGRKTVVTCSVLFGARHPAIRLRSPIASLGARGALFRGRESRDFTTGFFFVFISTFPLSICHRS